jgi:hypothetical protein
MRYKNFNNKFPLSTIVFEVEISPDVQEIVYIIGRIDDFADRYLQVGVISDRQTVTRKDLKPYLKSTWKTRVWDVEKYPDNEKKRKKRSGMNKFVSI